LIARPGLIALKTRRHRASRITKLEARIERSTVNQKKLAATVLTVGILGASVAACDEKPHPLNERMFADVICMKACTSGGSGSNCSAILRASTIELENCIPQTPSSPISSMSELARYCPSVAVRIANNGYSGASTTPTPTQGTDTNTDVDKATDAAPETENMSDLEDRLKTMGLGILALLGTIAVGFWMRARRDRQNRTAQRAHAAEHGWHN
jgi:hypothetical protein